MPVNQVYKATGEKIIDISDSTVTATTMAQGVTAYDASGTKIMGNMQGGLEMNVKFTAGNKTIPNYMFYNNHGSGSANSTYLIEEVVIGDGITSIGDRAFLNCSSLTSVTIGNGVTSIHMTAFNGCSNLTIITINKPQGSVSGSPWGATNATVVWTG